MGKEHHEAVELLEQATAITRVALERLEGGENLTECNMLHGALGLFGKAHAALMNNSERDHAAD